MFPKNTLVILNILLDPQAQPQIRGVRECLGLAQASRRKVSQQNNIRPTF